MDATNKRVNLGQQIDKQGQYTSQNCVLVQVLQENKTENADYSVISTISENLKMVILEEDINRYHRGGTFGQAKANQRSVTVKISGYNVCHDVFANKQKLKGKEISISENLSELPFVKLNKTTQFW